MLKQQVDRGDSFPHTKYKNNFNFQLEISCPEYLISFLQNYLGYRIGGLPTEVSIQDDWKWTWTVYWNYSLEKIQPNTKADGNLFT